MYLNNNNFFSVSAHIVKKEPSSFLQEKVLTVVF